MGKPASRITDKHVCLLFDGPKPHVGGVVMPPGMPTVLIGGLPAAMMGDFSPCVSPVPNNIVFGSVGVFIGGRPAARMFDKTLHGGSMLTGAPTVLIGDIGAVVGPAIFPGKQNYNNCGVQVSQQLIHQITGVVHKEDALLDEAIKANLAHRGIVKKKEAEKGVEKTYTREEKEIMAKVAPNKLDEDYKLDSYLYGRTDGASCQKLLARHKVTTDLVPQPKLEDLTEALKEGKGVWTALDAGLFYGGKPSSSGHAVLIYDGDFNEDGQLTHVYLNDTDAPDPDQRKGRCVPIADMMKALNGYKDKDTKKPLAALVVTRKPLWNSTPMDIQAALSKTHA